MVNRCQCSVPCYSWPHAKNNRIDSNRRVQIEIKIQNLKWKLTIKIDDQNLKLELKIEMRNRNWKLNLKIETKN